MPKRDLILLDAAKRVADQINALIDESPRGRLLHVNQMRASVQSIAANISEGLGRRPGRDRARSFEIARGETEETITHLSANFRIDRIDERKYWPIHNRLVVIVKMVDSFLREGPTTRPAP
jgi:four helix bundle protein